MAQLIQDTELWALCKELESLGGGIKTRLESVALLNLTKSEDCDPPYLKHESHCSRPIKVSDISGYLQNVSKFVSLGFNSTLITSGPSGSGKTTFLFNTSFWKVLLSELVWTDFDEVFFEVFELLSNDQLQSLL
jgi:hypothetical protein